MGKEYDTHRQRKHDKKKRKNQRKKERSEKLLAHDYGETVERALSARDMRPILVEPQPIVETPEPPVKTSRCVIC